MAGRRGRSDAAKLGRLGRILLLLRAHPAGLTTEQLLGLVGYGEATGPSRRRTLNRDLVALAEDGWRIETRETANTPAVRVLRTVDNRFATLFTPGQRAQLARAAACAGPDVAEALAGDLGRSPGPPAFVAMPHDGMHRLGACQAAAADRCRLRFTYNGIDRVAHPFAVLLRPAGWYLGAVDVGDGVAKYFAIDRIRDLVVDPPGSAAPPPRAVPPPVWDFTVHPVHAPYRAIVDTPPQHLAEVLSALGGNGHELVEHPDPHAATVRVEVVVRNTEALVDRLVVLGTRALLVGPEAAREALRERLVALVPGGAR
ncbi:MAG: WYL domain-containing protein [Candidatus Nanopelagicales bacterium]|jgi:predicted DNA-binding transcriptional regulator YafY|nr:WYL domain-containing protein [Candidatus Nanopelagicales bacterium]